MGLSEDDKDGRFTSWQRHSAEARGPEAPYDEPFNSLHVCRQEMRSTV